MSRIELRSCPPAAVAPLATRLARLQVAGFSELSALLRRPGVWPIDLTRARASEVLEALTTSGCDAVVVETPPSGARCPHHPALIPDRPCDECRASVCVLCLDGERWCAPCRATKAGATRRQQLRLVPLLVVLGVVMLGAIGVLKQRSRRRAWERPLRVTVVLASPAPLTPDERSAWSDGVSRINEWFRDEAARYGLTLESPVQASLAAEVLAMELPTAPVATGATLDDARAGLSFRRSLEALAPRTAADLTVLVALRHRPDGALHLVEGTTEAFGSLALVEGTAGDTAVSLELIAVAHEILHAVGAADAYDAEGHPIVPDGLANPDAEEQAFAEIMAGEFPRGAARAVPRSLDEVRLGPATARAIGFAR